LLLRRRPPTSTRFPYTTLFRSSADDIPASSADNLAFFDHLGTSNGPAEVINGRLEHLRGIALGFRNRGNYLICSLLHAGELAALDRKSTRLNSSHVSISYAVFC